VAGKLRRMLSSSSGMAKTWADAVVMFWGGAFVVLLYFVLFVDNKRSRLLGLFVHISYAVVCMLRSPSPPPSRLSSPISSAASIR
jgi:hypothetical protein